MKRPSNNFVVEYKGARRKTVQKSGSIWADTDLRAFSEGGEETATSAAVAVARKPSDAERGRDSPALTGAGKQMRNSNVAKEGPMADETNAESNLDIATATSAQPVTEPKKRGPRARKTAPDAAAADVMVETPWSSDIKPAKRGRRKATEKTKPAKRVTRSADHTVTGRRRTPAAVAAETSIPAGDEMADLLQLEQENQRLRKLLSEKLRDENATLRKRLGLD